MKFALMFLLMTASLSVMANEVKNFNKELLKTVKEDLNKGNDDQLKTKAARGPASVEEEDLDAESEINEDLKIQKNNQLPGSGKW